MYSKLNIHNVDPKQSTPGNKKGWMDSKLTTSQNTEDNAETIFPPHQV